MAVVILLRLDVGMQSESLLIELVRSVVNTASHFIILAFCREVRLVRLPYVLM